MGIGRTCPVSNSMKLGGAARADPASSGAVSNAAAARVCKKFKTLTVLGWGPTPFIWLSFCRYTFPASRGFFAIDRAANFANELISSKNPYVNKNQSLIKMSERSDLTEAPSNRQRRSSRRAEQEWNELLRAVQWRFDEGGQITAARVGSSGGGSSAWPDALGLRHCRHVPHSRRQKIGQPPHRLFFRPTPLLVSRHLP